jgi:hypothetical protein
MTCSVRRHTWLYAGRIPMMRRLFAVAVSSPLLVLQACTADRASQLDAAVAPPASPVSAPPTVCMCPALDPFADNATMFFHWGTTDANRDLLTAASYPTPNGHEQQAAPEDAKGWINPPLINLTRRWYSGMDAEGPGLYISNNPFDSSGYGPDLLVVTRAPQGASLGVIDRIDSSSFSQRVNVAVQAGADGNLPVMGRYESTWYVVSRAPHDGDDMWLYIRPPRASDVQVALQTLFHGKAADTNVANLSYALLNSALATNANLKTPTAVQFVKQLVAAAPAAMADVKTEQLSEAGIYQYRASLAYVTDPALKAQLAAKLEQGMVRGNAVLDDGDWVQLAIDYAQLASSDQAALVSKFATAISATFAPQRWVFQVPGILTIGPTLLPKLDQATLQQVGDAVTSGLASARLNTSICSDLWRSVKVDLAPLGRTKDLGVSMAEACFGPSGYPSLPYYLLLSMIGDLAQAGATDGDVEQLFGQLMATAHAGSQAQKAAELATAYAVYVGAVGDDARRATMAAAFGAACTAANLQAADFGSLDLPTLYASAPWVRLGAFEAGLQLLVKVEPAAKDAVVAQLKTLSPQIPDTVERGNIDALAQALAGGTP